MDVKFYLGAIAVIINIFAYLPYFRDILAGKTKPHVFSWFGWMIMEFVAFLAIISDGGLAGSWNHLFTALICLGVVLLAVRYGEKKITKTDKICLLLSLIAIGLWYFTKEPLYAVILIVFADAFAYAPTFRKAFYKPYEETMITFQLSILKPILAVLALGNYSLTTVLFDAYLIISNTAFVIMLVIRRRQLAR
ncbi:MAG: hypothetical protein AABX35_04850 [Nanoarchaeota archaeon]